jgi:aminotransferase
MTPFAAGSKRIANLVQSDIRAMTKECIRLGGINLGQGLCELPTPEPIVDAAVAALKDDAKGVYSSPEGILPLRKAIAEKLLQKNNIRVNPETEIVVTNGATGGYAAALMALLNPGDGILLFEPYYGYHLNSALLAEIEPHFIPMRDPSLTLHESDIRAAIRPNTRAIVVCTPNNPSGKMWSESDIQLLSKIANEFNLLVITDEMYEFFRYENRPHLSPMAYPGLKDRTVTLMGLSKTFSITGWRLGYVAASEPLAQKIKLANDLFYVCAPTPLQHGVLAGFQMDDTYYNELSTEFETKRNQICEVLEKAGMPPIVPQGAYYVLANISRFRAPDSKTFAMTLLESAKVATVPGRAFFSAEMGEQYVRLCFAVNDEALNKACKNIAAFKGGF